MNDTKSLIAYAQLHNIKTRFMPSLTEEGCAYSRAEVLDEWMKDGVYGCAWIAMPATYKALREFLGY